MAAVLNDVLDPGRFDQRIVAGSIGQDEADYVSLRAPQMRVLSVRGLGRAPRPPDDLRALIGLIDVIRRFRPDVVHTHTAKAGVLGRLAAWSCRVPATVHSFHGHLLHGYFSPVGQAAVVGVERVMARRTTRLIAVGERTRTDLLAAGIGRPGQFAVVAPGTRASDRFRPHRLRGSSSACVPTLWWSHSSPVLLPSSVQNGSYSWPAHSPKPIPRWSSSSPEAANSSSQWSTWRRNCGPPFVSWAGCRTWRR